MREIKFRAWDKLANAMLELVTVGCSRKDRWHPLFIQGDYINGIEHEEYVLMQYTGLKDKNGKDIYEGDILSTDLSRPYLIVCFRNGAFMVQCHDDGKDYYDLMVSIEEENDQIEHLEVIGNIYENPEFLELMPE